MCAALIPDHVGACRDPPAICSLYAGRASPPLPADHFLLLPQPPRACAWVAPMSLLSASAVAVGPAASDEHMCRS